MTKSGSKYLVNSDIKSLSEYVQNKEKEVLEALYSYYKAAYILANSSHYRGGSADSFKLYLSKGPINAATELMDIASDLTLLCGIMEELFLDFEKSKSGEVSDDTLHNLAQKASGHQHDLLGSRSQLTGTTRQASAYINPVSLDFFHLEDCFNDLNREINKIERDLDSADAEARSYIDDLADRIEKGSRLIAGIYSTCYGGGSIDYSSISKIESADWYIKGGNVSLTVKLQEDPFAYDSTEVSLSEDQWVAGLCQDIYAYAGYKFISASSTTEIDGRSISDKRSFSALKASAYGQITEWLHGEANARAGYFGSDAKFGIKDGYVGFHLNGEVGLFKADGKLVIGNEYYDGHISGEVDVLTADGAMACEFEDDGEFAIGIKGSATGASVKGEIGFGLFEYGAEAKEKEGDGTKEYGKKKTLLGANVQGKAGAGTSFGVWAQSEKAFETDYFNVNALSLDLDLEVVLGVNASITVPTIVPKWPFGKLW